MSLSPTPEGPQGLGWLPQLEAPARDQWFASGMPPRFVASAPSTPLPEAFTLAQHVLWWFNQGQVGSCAGNSTTGAVATSISFASANGPNALTEVQLSRAYIYRNGRKLDGLIGRGDGASITNCLRAVHQFGVCPEDLFPYKPDSRYLDQAPSAQAVAGAKPFGLTGLADLKFSDAEGIKASIHAGCPPVIGIWWPYGWDQGQIDQWGRTKGIGSGVFGHALYRIGWVNPGVWDNHLWWHIVNSHGPIYPLPSEEMRAKVQGYASARPDRCYSFWCRDDLLQTVAGYGYAEQVAPVGPFSPQVGGPSSWSGGLS